MTWSPLLLPLFATLFRSRKLFMTLGRLLLTSRPWYGQPGRPPTKRQTITRPFLDELKGRSNALSPSAHKRLLMGLLGDPVRAKVAKESSALLKTIQREEPGFQGRNSTRQFRRQRPYVYSSVNCYRCGLPGHFARDCGRGRGRGNSRR